MIDYTQDDIKNARVINVLSTPNANLKKSNDISKWALEKQITVKPININGTPTCPCGNEGLWIAIDKNNCNFCPSCGQRIDWSEE
ncbi:MAG: hypothetical protein FWE47_00115 [Oscillospiraceae bacterium]|nr:hypothetical protein [Oscillospiraceae bacterium]